jgi:hypothetical protein
MLDYQKNYTRKCAKRETKVYKKLVAQYHELLTAADEGVFQITVHSQSGTITVPVDMKDGSQLTVELLECFIKRIERNLNSTLVELGYETRQGKEKAAETVAAEERTAV